jgi:hypothetical protein
MRLAQALLLVTAALPGLPVGGAEPLTRNCRVMNQASDVMVQFSSVAAKNAFATRVGDPAFYARLQGAVETNFYSLIPFGAFYYSFDALVDMDEIAQRLVADPVLSAAGLVDASSDHMGACFSSGPPASLITITEYHNRATNHYFLSSSFVENQAIDSGAAGPGWERTGEVFMARDDDGCQPPGYLVFRFYGAGPNSHFFTADPAECGSVHGSDPGWQFEGVAFRALMPTNGSCAAGTQPLYRLYNNRYAFNDSNHRYVVRTDLYAQMQAQGWVGEGVAMCLRP